jgi:hypothetical protein
MQQSTGGLVGRYALTWMERNLIEHDVVLYISLDTPHWGASISLGNQYFIRFASKEIAPVRRLLENVIYSPAAKQLLFYHESTDVGGRPSFSDFIGRDIDRKTVRVGPDPMYTQFFGELRALGNYPTKPRKIAFANGNGNGVPQNFTAGQKLLFLRIRETGIEIVLESFVMGNQATRIFTGFVDPKIRHIRSYFERTYTASGVPYDYAPGGTEGFTRAAAATAPFHLVKNLLGDLTECFVPTLSAIDAEGDRSDPFKPGTQARTPFDAVFFAPEASNERHVRITRLKQEQLFSELATINDYTVAPTWSPTWSPTKMPSGSPTLSPSVSPTFSPTRSPTNSPSMSPTSSPENQPSQIVKQLNRIQDKLDRLARMVNRRCKQQEE